MQRISIFSARTIIATLFAIAAGTAQAADLQPVLKAPPVVAVAAYNWTGFYIGGHGGWARTGKEWELPGAGLVAEYGQSGGGVYGGQAGYNWQTGSWVLGVEAQASFGKIRKGVLWSDPNPSPAQPFWTDPDPAPADPGRVVRPRTGTTVENLGSIAARAGYAFDRTLVFAKGGVAWATDLYRAFDGDRTPERLLATAKDTRWGWMVGAGVEYGITPNWSAKVEFDYIYLGTDRVTLVGAPGVTPAARDFDIRQDIALVKAGINYRFGGW